MAPTSVGALGRVEVVELEGSAVLEVWEGQEGSAGLAGLEEGAAVGWEEEAALVEAGCSCERPGGPDVCQRRGPG